MCQEIAGTDSGDLVEKLRLRRESVKASGLTMYVMLVSECEPARMLAPTTFGQFIDFPRLLRPDADVNRTSSAVKVDPVISAVLGDPFGHVIHVFVFDEEVDSGSESRTDRHPAGVQFA